MKFTISPFSLAGIILGLVIQTFYGWHVPKTAMDAISMGFHIFIMPTLIALFGMFVAAIFLGMNLLVFHKGKLVKTGKYSWKIERGSSF